MKTKCPELGVATMKPLYLFQETLPSSDRKQSCRNNYTALRNFKKKNYRRARQLELKDI